METKKELSSKRWDVIVVGAGHNGLVCAAYLARSGKRVLVLESRERVGGACTIEETWPGYRVSPCAYVIGLLHPRVMHELRMKEHGFRWQPAVGGMFVPFEDGSSILLHQDDRICEAEVKAFAPKDFDGWKAMAAVKKRLRDKIRPDSDADLWLNPNPTREEIENRLKGDEEARKLLFEWSMVEFVENYLSDERFQRAYLGQGVIGTNASPFDPGTASVHFHHISGRMDGDPGTWGYVIGGMGTVSFILAEIAREEGAVIATEMPVLEILPGEGVRLETGEKIESPVVVSNADPRRTLKMLGKNADEAWRKHVESVPIQGCTVKVNLAVKELPNFKARPGTLESHHYAQTNTPLTKEEWKRYPQEARDGILPERMWTEIYLQSPVDPSVAPAGKHTMTVFSQYVPHTFKKGTWDENREEVGRRVIKSISRFCTNLPDAILKSEVLGPPDIEKRVGLTGGHIFQGEILPQYMWEKRLKARTSMPGVFLCGAGTHPGGSVIGVNGRNAAMEVLKGS
jgi:phytoene dehydrogenase-like protein